ncbi:PREDICTED: putative uncharacterized protein DDB_G0282133 [Cyphomyrmex costatus]|uniref:putative uncharacterized protein DDB_G0282133 n=1 Tax=Cyphomyrmex costatus TaxID=456900 RepID=UPI0008523842|nr:PREDICTED: putative uncharacterized protein DDB_G0282133 [Cyphomyrmex costatus]
MAEHKEQVTYVFNNFVLKKWLHGDENRRRTLLVKLKSNLRELGLSKQATRTGLLQLVTKPCVIVKRLPVSNYEKQSQSSHRDDVEKKRLEDNSQDIIQHTSNAEISNAAAETTLINAVDVNRRSSSSEVTSLKKRILQNFVYESVNNSLDTTVLMQLKKHSDSKSSIHPMKDDIFERKHKEKTEKKSDKLIEHIDTLHQTPIKEDVNKAKICLKSKNFQIENQSVKTNSKTVIKRKIRSESSDRNTSLIKIQKKTEVSVSSKQITDNNRTDNSETSHYKMLSNDELVHITNQTNENIKEGGNSEVLERIRERRFRGFDTSKEECKISFNHLENNEQHFDDPLHNDITGEKIEDILKKNKLTYDLSADNWQKDMESAILDKIKSDNLHDSIVSVKEYALHKTVTEKQIKDRVLLNKYNALINAQDIENFNNLYAYIEKFNAMYDDTTDEGSICERISTSINDSQKNVENIKSELSCDSDACTEKFNAINNSRQNIENIKSDKSYDSSVHIEKLDAMYDDTTDKDIVSICKRISTSINDSQTNVDDINSDLSCDSNASTEKYYSLHNSIIDEETKKEETLVCEHGTSDNNFQENVIKNEKNSISDKVKSSENLDDSSTYKEKYCPMIEQGIKSMAVIVYNCENINVPAEVSSNNSSDSSNFTKKYCATNVTNKNMKNEALICLSDMITNNSWENIENAIPDKAKFDNSQNSVVTIEKCDIATKQKINDELINDESICTLPENSQKNIESTIPFEVIADNSCSSIVDIGKYAKHNTMIDKKKDKTSIYVENVIPDKFDNKLNNLCDFTVNVEKYISTDDITKDEREKNRASICKRNMSTNELENIENVVSVEKQGTYTEAEETSTQTTLHTLQNQETRNVEGIDSAQHKNMQQDATSNSELLITSTHKSTSHNVDEKDNCDMLENNDENLLLTNKSNNFLSISPSKDPSSEVNNSDNYLLDSNSTDDNSGDVEVEIKIKPNTKSRILQKISLKAPWSTVNTYIKNLHRIKDKDNSSFLNEFLQVDCRTSEKSNITNIREKEDSTSLDDNITAEVDKIICDSKSTIKDSENHSEQRNSQDCLILNEDKNMMACNKKDKDECIQSIIQTTSTITENDLGSSKLAHDTFVLGKQLQKINDKQKNNEQQNFRDKTLEETKNVVEYNQDKEVKISSVEKPQITTKNNFESIKAAHDMPNITEQLPQTSSDMTHKKVRVRSIAELSCQCVVNASNPRNVCSAFCQSASQSATVHSMSSQSAVSQSVAPQSVAPQSTASQSAFSQSVSKQPPSSYDALLLELINYKKICYDYSAQQNYANALQYQNVSEFAPNVSVSNINAQQFLRNARFPCTQMPNHNTFMQSSTMPHPVPSTSNINQQQLVRNSANFTQVPHSKQIRPNIHQSYMSYVPPTAHSRILNANPQPLEKASHPIQGQYTSADMLNIQHGFINMNNISSSNVDMCSHKPVNQGNVNVSSTTNTRQLYTGLQQNTINSTATASAANAQQQKQMYQISQMNSTTTGYPSPITNQNIPLGMCQIVPNCDNVRLPGSSTINPDISRTNVAMGNVRYNTNVNQQQTSCNSQISQTSSGKTQFLPQYDPNKTYSFLSQPAYYNIQMRPIQNTLPNQNMWQVPQQQLVVNQGNTNMPLITNTKQSYVMLNTVSNTTTVNNQFSQRDTSTHLINSSMNNILQNVQQNMSQKLPVNQENTNMSSTISDFIKNMINKSQTVQKSIGISSQDTTSQNKSTLQENTISVDELTKTHLNQDNENSLKCNIILEKQSERSIDLNISKNSKPVTVRSNSEASNEESPCTVMTKKLLPKDTRLQEQDNNTLKKQSPKNSLIDTEKRSQNTKTLSPEEMSITEVSIKNLETKTEDNAINESLKAASLYDSTLSKQSLPNLQDASTENTKDQSEITRNNANNKGFSNTETESVHKTSNIVILNNSKNVTHEEHKTSEFCSGIQVSTNERSNSTESFESFGKLYIDESAENQCDKVSFEENILNKSQNSIEVLDTIKCDSTKVKLFSLLKNTTKADLCNTHQDSEEMQLQDSSSCNIKSVDIIKGHEDITKENEQLLVIKEIMFQKMSLKCEVSKDTLHVKKSMIKSINLDHSEDIEEKRMEINTQELSEDIEKIEIDTLSTIKETNKNREELLKIEEIICQKMLSKFKNSEDMSSIEDNSIRSNYLQFFEDKEEETITIGTQELEDIEKEKTEIDTHSSIKAINEQLKYVCEQKYGKSRTHALNSFQKNDSLNVNEQEDAKMEFLDANDVECISLKSDDSNSIPSILNIRSISPSLYDKIESINVFFKSDTKLTPNDENSLDINDNLGILDEINDKPCLRCKRKSMLHCQTCLQAHYCSERCSSLHWIAEHYKQCTNYNSIICIDD